MTYRDFFGLTRLTVRLLKEHPRAIKESLEAAASAKAAGKSPGATPTRTGYQQVLRERLAGSRGKASTR